jgi:hypothetical protein
MKKIFIVGAAHSGTTILYKMLAYHPDLCWFCQFSQRRGRLPGRKYIPFSDFYKRQIRILVSHSWKKGKVHLWIPRPGEAWSILNFVFQVEDQEGQKKRFRAIVDNELESWNKKSIIIKNPELSIKMELLQDTFSQNVIFIHIVRDGRAVILSNFHKFRRHYPESEALDRAISYWCDYMNATIRFQKKTKGSNVLVLRYEDFIKDIHSNLKSVFRLGKLDHKMFDYNRVPVSLSSTNSKWINDQNSELIERIEERAFKYLKYFEYL